MKEFCVQEIKAVFYERKSDIELTFNNSYDVAIWLIEQIGNMVQEYLVALYLNTKNEVICFSVVHIGTINHSIAMPRDILQRALLVNSSRIIISHNHPSGKVEPSVADKNFTKALEQACRLFSIDLLDHIIVSDNDYFSFRGNGLL